MLAGTTGYGPAENPDPVDGRIGVQFIGWTNKVDGGAVVLTANLPAADGDATWTAAFGPLVLQHVGAKSEEGFIILDPDDTAADDKQVEFTAFDPAAGAGTATATISAAMLNPNGATSVTLQLIYRTTLTGADQYVDAVVSDIDTAAGTATVTLVGKGIYEGLEPPAEATATDVLASDAELAARGFERLPRNLGEAVERFAESDLMREVLGDHIFDFMVTAKRNEWEEFSSTVTDWERVHYYAGF